MSSVKKKRNLEKKALAEQTVAKKKRNRKKFFIFLGIAMVLGLAAMFLSNSFKKYNYVMDPKQRYLYSPEQVRHLMPLEFDFTTKTKLDETIPPSTAEQFSKALDFILAFENSPELQTGDDEEIFKLVHLYKNRQCPYSIKKKTVKYWGAPSALGCRLTSIDEYVIGDIAYTTPVFAASLYHEILHMVDSRADKKINFEFAKDISYTSDPHVQSIFEWRSYASQIRFFSALIKGNMFPEILSIDDFGCVQQSIEAAQAIYDGKFCQWYKDSIKDKGETKINKQIFVPIK